MRNILIIALPLVLAGCGLFQQKPDIKIETVTVDKPILYCPVPPEMQYPHLLIQDLVPGDEKDPGRVAQYYKATVKQMEGEIKSRDLILEAYRKIQQQGKDLTPVEVDKMFKGLIKNEAPTVNK